MNSLSRPLLSYGGHRTVQSLALVFITAVLTFSFRDRDIGTPGIDGQNAAKLLTWIGLVIYCGYQRRNIAKYITHAEGHLSLFIAGLALLSPLWSITPLYSFACALGFLAYLGFAILSIEYFDDGSFFRIIYFSLCFFIILGLGAGIVAPDMAWQPPSVEETMYRLSGLAVNSNNFGRMSALCIIIGLGALMEGYLTLRSAIIGIALSMIALILSGSRTSILAACISVVIILIFHFNYRRIFFYTLSSALAILLCSFAYGASLQSFLTPFSRTGLNDEILTLTGRTELWTTALTLIEQKPFFGWGFNGTEDLLNQSMPELFYGAPVNAHQMFLHLALGLGLIGCLPAIGIFTIRFVHFLKEPVPLRDMVIGFFFVSGFAEVDLFATPLFTSLLFFRLVMSDHVRRSKNVDIIAHGT